MERTPRLPVTTLAQTHLINLQPVLSGYSVEAFTFLIPTTNPATDADVYLYYHHECSQYNAGVRNSRADKSTCKPQAPIQSSVPLSTGTCLKKPAGKIYSISLDSYTDPIPAYRSIARSYTEISRQADDDTDEDDPCNATGL